MKRGHADRNVIFGKAVFRRHRLVLCLFFCVLMLSAPEPAQAEDTTQQTTQQTTRIETDQDKDQVIIYIDDKPLVIIDEAGIHVDASIDYKGTISDDGDYEFQKALTGQERVFDGKGSYTLHDLSVKKKGAGDER